ncbi:MAG: hypothetical protein WCH46_01110 [bacterium]
MKSRRIISLISFILFLGSILYVPFEKITNVATQTGELSGENAEARYGAIMTYKEFKGYSLIFLRPTNGSTTSENHFIGTTKIYLTHDGAWEESTSNIDFSMLGFEWASIIILSLTAYIFFSSTPENRVR